MGHTQDYSCNKVCQSSPGPLFVFWLWGYSSPAVARFKPTYVARTTVASFPGVRPSVAVGLADRYKSNCRAWSRFNRRDAWFSLEINDKNDHNENNDHNVNNKLAIMSRIMLIIMIIMRRIMIIYTTAVWGWLKHRHLWKSWGLLDSLLEFPHELLGKLHAPRVGHWMKFPWTNMDGDGIKSEFLCACWTLMDFAG